jgi:DNA-directed RNA polymerase specialized sigma24 family protein
MGDDSDNDEQLWARSLAGDETAFAALFDRHGNRVFGHAHRLVDDRHTAQDVTAATFLELWRCRDRVRLVNASAAPWLLVTATNVARNQTRRCVDTVACWNVYPGSGTPRMRPRSSCRSRSSALMTDWARRYEV